MKNKWKVLLLGLLLDLIGVVTSTWVLPIIGEFTDIVWAPLAAYFMTKMYKGTMGKAAGVVTFIEEVIPGLDIIPSFTIMWFYTYIIRRPESAEDANVIDLN
ncbi:hypothetical protein [Croceiramulus getboli]|nr:hypothetical protein P8624_10550 [Flavobacteriaceae bacterium YJPT1-3]